MGRVKIQIVDNVNTKWSTYLTNHQHKATARELVFMEHGRHISLMWWKKVEAKVIQEAMRHEK